MGISPINLAPQDPVSCDKSDYGWQGGYLDRSWNYAMNTGLVTDACLPYTSGNGQVPPCPTACKGSGSWVKYKCASGSVINVGGNVERMKN